MTSGEVGFRSVQTVGPIRAHTNLGSPDSETQIVVVSTPQVSSRVRLERQGRNFNTPTLHRNRHSTQYNNTLQDINRGLSENERELKYGPGRQSRICIEQVRTYITGGGWARVPQNVTFQNFEHQIACIAMRGEDTDKNTAKFIKTRHFKRKKSFFLGEGLAAP